MPPVAQSHKIIAAREEGSLKGPSPRSRKPSELPTSLQHRLSSYAMAAGAAGVALLALAPPSEAEVVYTRTNKVIGRDGTYNLDVNNDGIADYMLAEHANQDGNFGTVQILSMKAATANLVDCPSTFCISGDSYAIALALGSSIGPNQHIRGWRGGPMPMAVEFLAKGGGVYYSHATLGFVNVKDRYLGLKFKINGEYHYGWARVTVKFKSGPPATRTWETQLTGYAYETVAGKAITAGQTKGSDLSDEEDAASTAPSKVQPNGSPNYAVTLGSLALGSSVAALWRREDSAGLVLA